MSYFDLNNYSQLKDTNITKVIHLSKWIWKNDLNRTKVENWLDNFSGKVDDDLSHEEINSLFLLKQFMYFGQREFREMLQSAYHKLFFKPSIHRLKKDRSMNKEELEHEMKNILSRTRFMGVGNVSESSSLMLYYFRQVNKLQSNLFWNVHEMFQYEQESVSTTTLTENKEKIENYIFLDDISGSGTQAYNFFTGKNRDGNIVNLEIINQIKKLNPDANIYYITLFSTNSSNQKLEELTDLTLKSVFVLDDSYKVFEEQSRYFPQVKNNNFLDKTNKQLQELRNEEIKYASNVSSEYFPSLGLESYYKYGFKNSQLLISFFYNTPNNTLPIFWVNNNNWNSIFERFEKVIEES